MLINWGSVVIAVKILHKFCHDYGIVVASFIQIPIPSVVKAMVTATEPSTIDIRIALDRPGVVISAVMPIKAARAPTDRPFRTKGIFGACYQIYKTVDRKRRKKLIVGQILFCIVVAAIIGKTNVQTLFLLHEMIVVLVIGGIRQLVD
jgi:hypothetical protein